MRKIKFLIAFILLGGLTWYFIINDYNSLSTQDDWTYNTSTNVLYVYSSGSPTNITATSSFTRGISLTGSYVNFENLEITEFGDMGIYINGSNVTIDNCLIKDNYDKSVTSYNAGININVINSNVIN